MKNLHIFDSAKAPIADGENIIPGQCKIQKNISLPP